MMQFEFQEKVSSSVWPICTTTIVRADRAQAAVYNKPSYNHRINQTLEKGVLRSIFRQSTTEIDYTRMSIVCVCVCVCVFINSNQPYMWK